MISYNKCFHKQKLGQCKLLTNSGIQTTS